MTTKQLLLQAQQALQAGQKPQAVRLLKEGLHQNPNDYRLWLMLARVAPSEQAQVQCIQRAAVLAPDNPTVQKAQRWLAQKQQAAAPKPAPTQTKPKPQPLPDHTLTQLRERSQVEAAAAAPSEKAPRKRRWLWGGAAVLVAVVVIAVGLMMRSGYADRLVAAENQPVVLAAVNGQLDPAASQGEDDDSFIAAAGYAEATATPTALPPTATPTSTQSPLLAKEIAAKNNTSDVEPRATWTQTPTPTNTPVPSPTIPPTRLFDGGELSRPLVGPSEKWIDVNLTEQILRAYEGETLVFETYISSGLPQYATVTGQFRIYYRLESQTMDGRRLGFDYVTENVPYVQYFYGDFALHGAWWHNNFGQQMSHGCVNLSVPDSEWLYEWAGMGTLVNVHY